MVFGLFKGGSDNPDDLIARKEFAKAIGILETQLKKDPKDQRVRQKLADALAGDGKTSRAVEILLAVADEFANDGFMAKSVAVLKKIQKIDPSRADVESRLHQLAADSSMESVATSTVASAGPASDFGFEEVGDDFAGEVGTASDKDPNEEEPGDNTNVRTRKAVERRWRDISATPLFTDFTKDELIAVIQGMKLRRYRDGDIIVTEGEEGSSLFLLTTGEVKVFTKNPKGQHVHLAELGEGEFFGEVSVLTGKPRTATITASTECEALELSRPTLEGICVTHPRVREVLDAFYKQRAARTVEAMIDSLRGAKG